MLVFFDHAWGRAPSLPDLSDVEFTFDRSRFVEADVAVIHVPEWSAGRILSKRPRQIWVAWTAECELHYPLVDPRFDLSMSYRLDSDVPATYIDSFGSSAATVEAFARSPVAKRDDALAAVFVSSSYDLNGRCAFIHELAQHVPLHSYGSFMQTHRLEPDLGRQSKLATISTYRFALAFENASSRDYVTEKFFDPLGAGSVPVYLGAPNVDDFAPGSHCFIDANDFDSPAELASQLWELANDDATYAAYHDWRNHPLRPLFVALLPTAFSEAVVRLVQACRERLTG